MDGWIYSACIALEIQITTIFFLKPVKVSGKTPAECGRIADDFLIGISIDRMRYPELLPQRCTEYLLEFLHVVQYSLENASEVLASL